MDMLKIKLEVHFQKLVSLLLRGPCHEWHFANPKIKRFKVIRVIANLYSKGVSDLKARSSGLFILPCKKL